MDLKHSKISFQVPKSTFECCFKTKRTLNNILEYSRIIPASFHLKFLLFFKKRRWKLGNWRNIIFCIEFLTSIPFGGTNFYFHFLWSMWFLCDQYRMDVSIHVWGLVLGSSPEVWHYWYLTSRIGQGFLHCRESFGCNKMFLTSSVENDKTSSLRRVAPLKQGIILSIPNSSNNM